MFGVRRQTGVVDLADGWMGAEEQRQVVSCFTLTLRTNAQCLESTQQQRRVSRRLQQQRNDYNEQQTTTTNLFDALKPD